MAQYLAELTTGGIVGTMVAAAVAARELIRIRRAHETIRDVVITLVIK